MTVSHFRHYFAKLVHGIVNKVNFIKSNLGDININININREPLFSHSYTWKMGWSL